MSIKFLSNVCIRKQIKENKNASEEKFKTPQQFERINSFKSEAFEK